MGLDDRKIAMLGSDLALCMAIYCFIHTFDIKQRKVFWEAWKQRISEQKIKEISVKDIEEFIMQYTWAANLKVYVQYN